MRTESSQSSNLYVWKFEQLTMLIKEIIISSDTDAVGIGPDDFNVKAMAGLNTGETAEIHFLSI